MADVTIFIEFISEVFRGELCHIALTDQNMIAPNAGQYLCRPFTISTVCYDESFVAL